MSVESNSLVLLVFLAGIILVLISPRKRSALARMGAALLISLVILAIVGALLRIRDLGFGVWSAQVSILIAVGAGLMHLLPLKRKSSELLLGALFAAFVVALFLWQPVWLFQWTDFKTGNDAISRVESYRKRRGRLPNTLEDVGLPDPDLRVFYQTIGKDQYCVWFGTWLGEAESYDSRTKKWEPLACDFRP